MLDYKNNISSVAAQRCIALSQTGVSEITGILTTSSLNNHKTVFSETI